MKEIMVAVASLDGKITKGDSSDIKSWTSPEDQAFFASKMDEAKLVVMGRKTYETVKDVIKHKPERRRVIMTSHPEDFQDRAIEGMLEFTSETPAELVNRFDGQYDEMLVVGGSQVFTSFMKERLISEVMLTVEPLTIGDGIPLFTEPTEAKLQYEEVRKLNSQGTVLYRYLVK